MRSFTLLGQYSADIKRAVICPGAHLLAGDDMSLQHLVITAQILYGWLMAGDLVAARSWFEEHEAMLLAIPTIGLLSVWITETECQGGAIAHKAGQILRSYRYVLWSMRREGSEGVWEHIQFSNMLRLE